jgi:hypothetical protein
MAGKFVFQPQLFLLEAVENGFVGVGAVLFNDDLSMDRCVLGCEGLDVSIVHRSISFRWLSRDGEMNKPRKMRRVFIDHQQFAGRLARLVAGRSGMTATRMSARAKR